MTRARKPLKWAVVLLSLLIAMSLPFTVLGVVTAACTHYDAAGDWDGFCRIRF